jgi:predicted DCC family thiol-disulfide oxidoreductase YuxK
MTAGGVPPDLWFESMHIVRPGGTVVSAGDAVIDLLALSPKTRWQAWAARLLPPLRKKIDREYRKLADRRGELSARVEDAEPVVVPPRWVHLQD